MSSFRIGFTGTRDGMTPMQVKDFLELLRYMYKDQVSKGNSVYFHHGDCIGADADAHRLAYLISGDIHIVIHPSNLETQRAFCSGYFQTHPPKAPLKRNRDIVDSVAVLIAAPKSLTEVLRSGTWATIRYARKRGVAVTIV